MGFSAGGILSGEMLLHFDGLVDGTALDPDYEPDGVDRISADAAACGMIYSFYGRLSVGTTDVELLQSGEPFTAVYAIADTLAIGACRALHEAGKRIPEDVSVAGFDGIPLGEYYIPKLSTMRQPVEAMADKTVRLLLQILEEGGSHEHLIFPAELVIRESTAPPG